MDEEYAESRELLIHNMKDNAFMQTGDMENIQSQKKAIQTERLKER